MGKTFLKPIILIMLAMVVFGCEQSVSPEPEPVTKPKLEGKSITIATTYGPNDGSTPAFEALCEEFSQESGVTITNSSSDATEEWKQGVISMFDNGTEPDVLFFFTGPDSEALIENGKFISYEEVRKVFPDYASNINLSVLDGLKSSDGKGYAIPVKGYWERLFINKDIFEELELSPPESYDDFFKLAPQLLEAGYIPVAASLGEVPHYLFEAFLFNFTGPSNHHNIPADQNNLPESWVNALEQFRAMYEAGMFPSDTDTITHAEAFELFQTKKAAMIVDGDWSAPYVRDSANTIVVNFPAIKDGARINTDLISGFSMGFYISSKAWNDAEKRDAAVAFVDFITSDNAIMKLNVSGAAMPIYIDGLNSGGLDDADATTLRHSIDELNMTTTAFVGAVGDKMVPEARAMLFGEIHRLAKGEIEAEELLREFITANNAKK